ncbi:hypothetical protein [Bacteroides sp. 519]|uniref:hypothetical protein n=1 Tax=Bacteroides sp. 519 TaxID=2302937 RepID=UPI0013D78074|nr:hypothetical protein [Bacteroides sp. 519]
MQKTISSSKSKQRMKVEMSSTQYKRYLAFLEAEKVVTNIKKSLRELQDAKKGKITLQSAYDLANEL